MNIQYKILCEVKILHEYFLTEGKGENIFAGVGQQQRLDFLFKQYRKGVPHIGDHFNLVFPESVRKVYEGYRLRIVPAYSGFKLAVGCKKKIMADGSVVFTPVVALPDQLEILVLLVPKPSIAQFSQVSFKSPLRSKKYFSNNDTIGQRTFPFLSLAVPPRDNSVQYEQGDVADTGSVIGMFLNNGAADPWKSLSGKGYSSSADTLLIPFRSSYYFNIDDSVTDAVFVLKDSNGIEKRRVQKSNTSPFRSVLLDFSTGMISDLKSMPSTPVDNQTLYRLEVTASNGYVRDHQVIFVDTEQIPEPAEAIVNLQPIVANPDFSMIDNEGNLPLKDGMNNPRIPVFEIWLKSKSVFLRYKNNKDKKLKLSAETTGLLIDDDGVLISENPVSLSHQPISYQKQDNSFQLLPNPSSDSMIVIEDGKVMAEMNVPVSKIFPLL